MKRTALSALVAFPLAAFLNSFSMTGLMLVLGIAGWYDVAAEIGLIQGATLALFFAFSANSRSLILADVSGFIATRLLQARLILLLPLAGISYVLSLSIGMASASLAVVLIARRMSEWIGEIGLATHERMNQAKFAWHVLVLESTTLILALLLLWNGLDFALSTIAWALAPLLAIRRAKLSWCSNEGRINFSLLIPHFGSTAIIGTCVYAFRLSIVLITGKTIAGVLFIAFAIGGLIPTIVGQALAPTLIHRFGVSSINRLLLFVSVSLVSLGLLVLALAVNPAPWLQSLNYPPVFWLAIGFSIAGGAIMTVAVSIRARLAQGEEGALVFGPDLIANVLVVASVPFCYQVFGLESLACLYALSGCLNLFFLCGGRLQGLTRLNLTAILFGIGGLLIFPLFFLADGSVFRDPSFLYDTGGTVSRLPIPISVLALFGGIAIISNYAAARLTLWVVFLTVLLFVVTLFASAQGGSMYDGAKLILMAQFLLPIFGLILGQMYGSVTQEPIFERVVLWVLLFVVPAQLAASWLNGYTLMSPMIFVFSIYQHLQYFPMIVAALLTMASLALWSRGTVTRIALTILMPVSMIQVVGSMSVLAIFGMVFGLAGFVFAHARKSESRRRAVGTIVATLFCGVAYVLINVPGVLLSGLNLADKLVVNMSWQDKLLSDTVNTEPLPKGLSTRFEYWRFYAEGVIESPHVFLVGHKSPPDRKLYPSAHNYWLDVLYNFGALALLPMIILLLMTLRSIWRGRAVILANPMLLGTVMAVIYLLLGENMVKTGMRQPYPGVITFFVWGLLITRLRSTATEKTITGEGIRS